MNAFIKGLAAVAILLFGIAAANAQVVIGNPAPGAPAPNAPAPATTTGLITKITPQQVVQLVSNAVKGVTISPQITKNNDGTYLVTFPIWGSGVYSAIN